MAKLRVFVSSTCYDLHILRSELRPFIASLGYEPVMSEYSDILYDPRSHTHISCLKEVPACDMVVLIIGSRFGGMAIPSALADLSFEILEQTSTHTDVLAMRDKLSITQLEVLKAIEQSIPIYTFVDDKVLHDHLVYEQNKTNKTVIDQITFPSINKRETAIYIFEFIDFLAHRASNNAIYGFSGLDQIRSHLSSQWSQLFQRLLADARKHSSEARRYRDFSERIEDLKAVVLASLVTPDLRETAKGAVQFRHLITFVSSLHDVDHRTLLLSRQGWDDLLRQAGIIDIRPVDGDRRQFRQDVFLVREDGTFYISRYPRRILDDLRDQWPQFLLLEDHAREAIVDALLEDREARGAWPLRYYKQHINEYLSERDAALHAETTRLEHGPTAPA